MKQILLILVVLALAGCGKKSLDPILEKAVRSELKKPTGKLTEADLKKVTYLLLYDNQLTELPRGLEKLTQLKTLFIPRNQLTEVPKGLEKLTQLTYLNIINNPDLTRAQLDELKKALPKCDFYANPTK